MNITLDRKALRPWAEQPRKTFRKDRMQELTDSLRAHGQWQPLIVRPIPEERRDPEAPGVTHEIIVGERRWRASEAAGLPVLECRSSELDDKQAAELALFENLQREDLSVMEEAQGLKLMVKKGWDVAEIATRSGRSSDRIYALLALCELDEGTQQELMDGMLSTDTARALGRIDDLERRKHARERIVKPQYQDQPLTQQRALDLIQREYLDPQKRAKAWARQEKKLAKEFPGAVIVPLLQAGNYNGWNSGWTPGEGCPGELADRYDDVDEEDRPTWGQLAEKHGSPRAVVPDHNGEPVLYVQREPVLAAERAAYEAKAKEAQEAFRKGSIAEDVLAHRLRDAAEECVFTIEGGEGRHQQGQENERRRQEAEARQRRQAEWRQAVLQGTAALLLGKMKDKELQERLRPALDWYLRENDYVHEEIPDLMVKLGIPEGDDSEDGEDAWERGKRWAEEQMAKHGLRGFVWVLLAAEASRTWNVVNLAPLARAVGLEVPEEFRGEDESEGDDGDEEEDVTGESTPDHPSGPEARGPGDPEDGRDWPAEAEGFDWAEFGNLDWDYYAEHLQHYLALETAKARRERIDDHFEGVYEDVPGHFVSFAARYGELFGMRPEDHAELEEALERHGKVAADAASQPDAEPGSEPEKPKEWPPAPGDFDEAKFEPFGWDDLAELVQWYLDLGTLAARREMLDKQLRALSPAGAEKFACVAAAYGHAFELGTKDYKEIRAAMTRYRKEREAAAEEDSE